MTEKQALAIADALGGETWQSGGDVWLVILRRSDGRLAVISDDTVCEYGSEDELEEGRPSVSIALA